LSNVSDEYKREIWCNFSEMQHIFLATVDGNQPKVRPVTLIRLKDRFFVATGSNDAKVRQLKQNPKAEFCLLLEKGESKGTLRAECSAKIVMDKGVKADVYNKVAFLKEFWKSPEDPGYTLVELQPSAFEYMKPGTIESVKVQL
jgi:uncharacterized pyridoxamine 5'-phosphate oxidase family protein